MWRLTCSGFTITPMPSPRFSAISVAAGRLGGKWMSDSSHRPECSNGCRWSFGMSSNSTSERTASAGVMSASLWMSSGVPPNPARDSRCAARS